MNERNKERIHNTITNSRIHERNSSINRYRFAFRNEDVQCDKFGVIPPDYSYLLQIEQEMEEEEEDLDNDVIFFSLSYPLGWLHSAIL